MISVIASELKPYNAFQIVTFSSSLRSTMLLAHEKRKRHNYELHIVISWAALMLTGLKTPTTNSICAFFFFFNLKQS